jgi:2-polyprenyl-6-methoxyphenol hydroxylase-like FAD-dependent oxidoreductase
VRARLGESRIHTGHRLGRFRQDEGGVTRLFLRPSRLASMRAARGDVLVGADGIHSLVRDTLYPTKGPRAGTAPCFGAAPSNGRRSSPAARWSSPAAWPQSSSSTRSPRDAAGPTPHQLGGGRPVGDGATPPPNKEDWSRPGRFEDLMPHVQRFRIPYVNAQALIEATPEFWEYPMCDRDPLPRWSHGRVTLLGDAAHPMYPVGSNGASQAILDARCLADRLQSAEHVLHGLWMYEQERLPMTAQIVRMNRKGGPEGVIDAVEERAPDGFSSIDDVLSFEQRKAIVRGYASTAGFAQEQVNKAA